MGLVTSSAFYASQMALVPALRAMTERGLLVDEPLRQERLKQLVFEEARVVAEMQRHIADLWDGLRRPDLFLLERVCPSCHNGKKKRLSCEQCGGQGKFYHVTFNPDSPLQVADVLYRALGLPPRYANSRETTDEEALQSLLALDKSGIVAAMLRFRKLATMREIYERLAPYADGRVRSVFNGAGTYTGRLASAAAFYVPASTNLQNLPSQEAARDDLYGVRDCIIPPPGRVLLYGDLSQAEARVVAYLSEDWELVERWQDPAWDIHRWTAAHIFGIAESSIGKDSPQRFLGKKSRHAFNYGEGPTKFWRTVNADADLTGFAITLAEAKACFYGYHKLHPNLDNVWWKRVEERLRQTERIEAEHCGWGCNFYVRFDPETDDLHPDSLRAGIAWEPQHTVAHITNDALRALHAGERGNGYVVVHQTHDGVVVEADALRWRSVAQRLKTELERPLTIRGRTFTIPAEVFICRARWSEPERIL